MARALVILCLFAGVAFADESSDKPHCADAAACKKACAKRDGEACWYAGAGFEPGDAGKGDLRKAKPFYDKACKLGVVRGCLSLATAERATPGPKGTRASTAAVKRAITLQTKACTKKQAEACDDVANMYATRLDKPDDKSAKVFRDKACRIRTNAPCSACTEDPADKEALQVATAANNKRFADELARQQLQLVKLPPHRWPASSGMKIRAGFWTVDAVAEVEAEGKVVRVVFAPDTGEACAAMQPEREYARKDNLIFRIERAPKVISSKSAKVCNCGPRCGGARPPSMHVGYEMPAGTLYGGVVKVAYDLDEVTVTNAACTPLP